MIWIYGGGFSNGQGISYDWSYLSVTGDVIVVTGFFAPSDGSAAGNYGQWDQRLAIQ
jgi:carboxylesterase type B